MEFNDPSQIEQITYDLRLADFPRAKNRARIDRLFNGVPPFSDDEEHKINVNPLGGTVMAHDARAQFYGAFLRPAQFFTATTDTGAKFKRGSYGNIVTTEVNRKMKRSMGYFETFRSKFAMDVLHGIAPTTWRNRDRWMPDATGIEDVGIPASTLLTMENLPFFYIYRSFTAPELIKLTNRKGAEAGWNMPLVKKCIEWVDKVKRAADGHELAGSLVAGEDRGTCQGRWRLLHLRPGANHQLLRLLLLERHQGPGGLEPTDDSRCVERAAVQWWWRGDEPQEGHGLRQEPVPVQPRQAQVCRQAVRVDFFPVRRPERRRAISVSQCPFVGLPGLRRLPPPEPDVLPVQRVRVRGHAQLPARQLNRRCRPCAQD